MGPRSVRALVQSGDISREQLFFLGQDPLERNDLSGDRRTAGIRDELRVEMIQWLKNHGDPLKYDSGGQ